MPLAAMRAAVSGVKLIWYGKQLTGAGNEGEFVRVRHGGGSDGGGGGCFCDCGGGYAVGGRCSAVLSGLYLHILLRGLLSGALSRPRPSDPASSRGLFHNMFRSIMSSKRE